MKIKHVLQHKPQHIYCELFMVNIYVSYGVSPENYQAAVRKYTVCEPSEVLIDGNATRFKDDGNPRYPIYWLWVKKRGDLQSLVHEICHVTCMIMEDRGVVLCEYSEEIYAYYMGMLMKKITGAKK